MQRLVRVVLLVVVRILAAARAAAEGAQQSQPPPPAAVSGRRGDCHWRRWCSCSLDSCPSLLRACVGWSGWGSYVCEVVWLEEVMQSAHNPCRQQLAPPRATACKPRLSIHILNHHPRSLPTACTAHHCYFIHMPDCIEGSSAEESHCCTSPFRPLCPQLLARCWLDVYRRIFPQSHCSIQTTGVRCFTLVGGALPRFRVVRPLIDLLGAVIAFEIIIESSGMRSRAFRRAQVRSARLRFVCVAPVLRAHWQHTYAVKAPALPAISC